MKRVTLAIEEDVLEKARLRAAREGTSVNEVIRKLLAGYGTREEERRSAMEDSLDAARRYQGGLGGQRWSRGEAHIRNRRRGW